MSHSDLVQVYVAGLVTTFLFGGLVHGTTYGEFPNPGEAVAFLLFWPLTLPIWLLIQLYRVLKNLAREARA